jgi:superfamily II DNA or RNA helicase
MSDKKNTPKKKLNLKKKKIIKTSLTQRGYALTKTEFGFKDINRCKKELTVSPFVNNNYSVQSKPFPIYLESNKKLYLPKYYGLDTFGEPDYVKAKKGFDIDLEFKGELRQKQLAPVKTFLDSCKKGSYVKYSRGGIISLPCGYGKCLGYNTPILMYDGTIKMVQDIKICDKLMGDDSKPRNVLSLARGREQMYKVIPTKGDPYIVNESHILSLKCSCEKSRYPKGAKVDMSVKEYLSLPSSYHGRAGPLLGYRVPAKFSEKPVDMEPYALGYWLGDGHSRTSAITTIEEPVINYFKNYSEKLGLKFIKIEDKREDKNSISYRISSGKKNKGQKGINKFLNMLKNNNLIQNKHIPYKYKCNVRQIQLELLAGIIDSDGHYYKGGYDIIQKRENLIDDIIYVARSLGFAAYKTVCEKSCMYKGEKRTGTYFRTNIHGKGLEEVPVKCPRKKASSRQQIKDVLSTRIQLEKLEVDDYYGFEIDGNRRFLLGDYTVTHNTILALYILSKLDKKTLVIVHKEFLINQWKERIAQFLPDARVGTIQAKIIDIDNKDIVIGMLQSLSMKEYPQDTFDSFGLTIVDECHHISAEVFSRSLPKVNSQYSLGLSATPKRKDGLSKVFYWFLGPMIYQISKRDDFPVEVNIAEYNCEDENYCKEEVVGFKAQICTPRMINNVTSYYRRLELVIQIIKKLLTQGKKILVLSDRRAHLTNIYTAVKERNISDIGYYVGGMKQKDLKLSEEKPIILGTYSMSSEGMDIPDLDAIIFASPKSDIIQSIGRILRKKHEKPPIAWDIVDNFSIFPRQYIKRRAYYRKMKYSINIYEINDNPNISIESMVSQLEKIPKKDCKKKRKKKKEPELAEYMFIEES